jgi:hypothetical protein
LIGLIGSLLAACATDSVGPGAAAPPVRDGLVFEGAVPGLPGSFGRLVLERSFRDTRMLRWQSADSQIGAAEVDFFQPQHWTLEGDPPDTLIFRDRSPGPILFGEVPLRSGEAATVNVILGQSRVRYTLERVGNGSADLP